MWYEGAGLTDRRWLHGNHQGSVIATSDGSAAGTVYSYGPWGEPTSWTGVRFRYTGQIALPEVQLYHYKARVYDPVLGRFLQTDPVGYKDDYDLYAYVGNDPVNKADPSGKDGLALSVEGWSGDDHDMVTGKPFPSSLFIVQFCGGLQCARRSRNGVHLFTRRWRQGCNRSWDWNGRGS